VGGVGRDDQSDPLVAYAVATRSRDNVDARRRCKERASAPMSHVALEAWKADGNGSMVPPHDAMQQKTPKITVQRNETKRTWPDRARDRRRYPGKCLDA
jgi:hypothetical protein